MEKEIIFLVEESVEGGFQAKALGHSIVTEADSFEELKKMIRMLQDVISFQAISLIKAGYT